jgi:HAD superfamily hydrolase (TIGR01490 family)
MSVNDTAYAFFDVDDTLVNVKTMFSFQDFWYTEYDDNDGRSRFEQDMNARHSPDASWEDLHLCYYRHFKGREVAAVSACAERWFSALLKKRTGLFCDNVISELRQHQVAGREPVFVSGSFPALLNPIARRLGVTNLLATKMEVKHQQYTGEIIPPQTIGAGKAHAIQSFLRHKHCDAGRCFAYGDDISDTAMLSAVGNPVVITGGRGLEQIAAEKSWRLLKPN